MRAPIPDAEFAAMLKQYQPQLLSYAYALTRSHADAQDLTQETMLRAWGARSGFIGERYKGWLLTILRNHWRDQCKRAGRWPLPLEVVDGLRCCPPAAYDAIALTEARRALADLKPHHRKVLALVRIHGASYVEAAATLGLPVGTVRSRLHRADAMLRRRSSWP